MFKKKVGRPSNAYKKRVRNLKMFGLLSIISVFAFTMFKLNNYVEVYKLKGDTNSANGITRTATFVTTNTDFVERTSISCQDTGNGCTITLPKFNRKGHYSSYWSIKPITSESLSGQQWSWNYFYPIGYHYTLKSDVTFYPNFNNFYYTADSNTSKYRELSIQSGMEIGKTDFEFENGIPKSVINKFTKFANEVYEDMSFEFTPTKVFVMTENTYSNYSKAYGLTHNFYTDSSHDYTSYMTVDLMYDASGKRVVKNEAQKKVVKNEIDENALVHELAHTWDYFYSYQTGKTLHDQDDIKEFFNEMVSNGSINSLYSEPTKEGGANIEWFAGMVTNYYWHILGKNDEKPYYALKRIEKENEFPQTRKMTKEEKSKWKKLMEKYIKKTNAFPINQTKTSSVKKIRITDENNKNITNKTVTKNLCVENKLYYTELSKNNVKYNLSNDNLKITKGNNVDLKYKASSLKLKKNATVVLTLYDKNNTSNKSKVTFINNTDCKIYNISNVTVDKIPDQASTKEVIKPELVVKSKNITLQKNIDYTVNYSNNIEKGIGKATIKGKGNYSGTKVVTYKIIKVTNETKNTIGAAKIQINIPQEYKNGACITSPKEIGFREISGKGISEIQYKTNTNTNWTNLSQGNRKAEVKIKISNSHEQIWFRIYDTNTNTKEFGPYKINIKSNCTTQTQQTSNTKTQPQPTQKTANIQINVPSTLTSGTCTTTAQPVKFNEMNGIGLKLVQYKSDTTDWKTLASVSNKSEIGISLKNPHNQIWFKVTAVNGNVKEFGPYKVNIKSSCAVQSQQTSPQPQPQQTQQPQTQPQQTGPVQVNTIKVSGIDTNGCKNRGISFTVDSTGDNGASISKIEFSTDNKTWKTSNSCTIGSKKATCKINNAYSAIYYKVTTSHNHYQIFGKYCTK